MKRYLYLSLVLILCTNTIKAQDSKLFTPANRELEQVIKYKHHTLSYNTTYVVSSWLCYKLNNQLINKSEEVKIKYKTDPNITAKAAEKKDYKGGGYLMAPMLNPYDIANDPESLPETFYMSNMLPMKSGFYSHIWFKAEELFRFWAGENELQITAGPILTEAPYPTLGGNKVIVPKRLYKVVYDPANQKAIGFIFKNGIASGTIKKYAVTIDEIEKETGVDFLHELDDELEEKLEASIDLEQWNWEMPD
ncbi:MAG: DNA/RNA non-specific endonuclease [Bacteroidales bacterium]|nr:DNA/RNA non-specific endonuclease [Bacteroidales bacterium]